MRSPPLLLIVSLLAAVTCFAPALGQQPGPVNIRQRVVAPAPGVPTVNVTVDRHRVPVNDEVTFTVSPAAVVANRNYTITLQFGDKKQTQVQTPQVIHRYRAAGNYKYSISIAGSDQGRVKPPEIPKVTLSAAPATVSIDQPVVFNAQLSGKYPNIEYRFVFADGSQTNWQKDPQTRHQYASAKTYLAYVDIGEAEGQSVRRIGGSERKAIKVSQPGSAQKPTVRLAARPVKVETRQFVLFTAKVVSNDPDVKYRFIFGDQTPATNWQVNSETRHRYLAPGSYAARVDVRVVNKQAGIQDVSSSPLSIEVKSTSAQPMVRLTATPSSVGENVPVFFRANLDSRNEDIRYRFNFGDGSGPTAWTDKAFETHAYARTGKYSPYVEIGRATTGPINAIASSGKQVTVTAFVPPPTPTPTEAPTPNLSSPSTVTPTPAFDTSLPSRGTTNSNTGDTTALRTEPTPGQKNDSPPNPWWPYLLIPLAVYAAYRIGKWLAAPRPTFHPRLDKGVSEVGVEKPLAIDFQIQLNPDISAGEYGIKSNEASFIRSERKSDD